MATVVHPVVRPMGQIESDGTEYVSQREGAAILDQQARTLLGMSGEEFVRRYRAGEIEDADRSDVLCVAMLIPLAAR